VSTYAELMAQANALVAQAEDLKKIEVAGVIADIRAKMKEYGITPSDLGGVKSVSKAKIGTSAAKYRGPNGQTWSGRGRPPAWVIEAKAAGKDLAEFAI
jgi:DNA-binding protein H-NS